MKIETFDDVERLLALCQKYGVHSISVDNVALRLAPTGPEPSAAGPQPILDPVTGMPLSEDELLFYASTNARTS